MVVPNHRASSLLPIIHANVLPGSVLYTDALRSYRGVGPEYVHRFIDHSLRFAEGQVHTNTIENFWSCIKRTLTGRISLGMPSISARTWTNQCSASTTASCPTPPG